jgi:hypothetical protein
MCRHLRTSRTDRIDNLGTLVEVGDFEFLLEEDARLLGRRLDDTLHKDVVGWRES